ncbi:MAG: four helix bundle protein [Bacteroidota bacterium]
MKISLKEIRETNYWLRIIIEIKEADDELSFLLNESEELKKIIGSICSKNSK